MHGIFSLKLPLIGTFCGFGRIIIRAEEIRQTGKKCPDYLPGSFTIGQTPGSFF
jgi:hypothetical protein